MSVSDITAYVKTEQGLADTAKSSAAVKQDTGGAFLFELKQADETSHLTSEKESLSTENAQLKSTKEDKPTQQDSSETISELPENEEQVEPNSSEQQQPVMDSSGDVMLAQITAAQAMDTAVKHTSTQYSQDNDVTLLSAKSGSGKSSGFGSALTQSYDELTNKASSNVALDAASNDEALDTPSKTKLADVVGEQLNSAKPSTITADMNPVDKRLNIEELKHSTATTQQDKETVLSKSDSASPSPGALLATSKEVDKSAALASAKEVTAKIDSAVEQLIKQQSGVVNNLNAGDNQGSNIASELNLTKAQTLQLNDKLTQLNAQPQQTPESKPATLKAMLTELVNTDKSASIDTKPSSVNVSQTAGAQEASLPVKTTFQLNALNTNEKNQLAKQIKGYISNENPDKTQLTKLNQVLAQLQLPSTVVNHNTPAVNPAAANMAQLENINQQVKDSNSELGVKALVQESIKQPERNDFVETITSANKETVLPRVTQLFNQLTAVTASPTPQELATVSYEQALDAHIAQAQTQAAATSSSVKTVNVDAGVMQALNIIKSDAAKMLQERVSAMLNINNKEAEIRLDPPEMGSMHIRIRSDAEQAQINFVVQNQQAKEALEQSLPKLRDMLAEQGIELGESSIEQGQSQAQQDESDETNNQTGLAKQQNDDESTVTSEQLAQSTGQESSSSIDYYA